MKIIWLLTVSIFLAVGSGVSGQSRRQFETALKIGPSRLFRDAVLKPKFSQGQLCRLILIPQAEQKNQPVIARVSGKTAYEVLELLGPEDKRGNRTENWGVALFLGRSYGISYEFENILVAAAGSIPRRGSGETMFELDNNPLFPSAQQITFTWNKRKCS